MSPRVFAIPPNDPNWPSLPVESTVNQDVETLDVERHAAWLRRYETRRFPVLQRHFRVFEQVPSRGLLNRVTIPVCVWAALTIARRV
jgi:hypothetical protein